MATTRSSLTPEQQAQQRAYERQWREKNRERRREYMRQWKEKNRARLTSEQYKAAQREYDRQYRSQWKDKNRERLESDDYRAQQRERMRQWKEKNRARLESNEYKARQVEYSRQWKQQNRDRVCAQARKRYQPKKARNHKLRSQYGISLADYDQLRTQQGHVCAICGIHEMDSKKKIFCVDHDHLTGAVRGLLCHPCNFALGALRDRPDVLRAAADYLERHHARLKQTA